MATSVTIHHPKVSPTVGGTGSVDPSAPGVVSDERAGISSRQAAGLLYSPIATMGIANSWTVAFTWSNANVTSDYTLLDIGNTADNTNRIRVDHLGATANDPLRILLYDSANALFKQYEYDTVAYTHADVGRHHHATITWNGTTLLFYNDGLLFAATGLTTDNAGTQTDTARRLAAGSTTAGAAQMNGISHTVALWSSVLTANEVASIYQAGHFPSVNLQVAFKDYNSVSSLAHWWSLGSDMTTSATVDRPVYSDRVTGSFAIGGAATASTLTNLTSVPAMASNLGFYPGRNYISLGTGGRALAATAAVVGIANTWTIAGVSRRFAVSATTISVIDISATANTFNEIRIDVLGATVGEPWRVLLYNTAGTIFKQYEFYYVDIQVDAVLSLSWIFWALTWDGTNLSLWRNGIKMTPLTKTTDNTGTQADTSRQVSIGQQKSFVGSALSMHLSEVMVWDQALSGTEIERLYDGGNAHVDYAEDTLGYYSSSHLKHWWRIGAVPRSIGTVSAVAGLVTDEVATGGLDVSALAQGTPTRTSIITGKNAGHGGVLECYSSVATRSLSAPAGNKIGIANAFCIGYWNYVVATPGTGVEQTFLDIGAGGPNGIRIYSTTALAEIKLWDRDGALFQHFTIGNGHSAGSVWRWQVLAWDGTTLAHFLNGTLSSQSMSTIVNNAGIMEDTPRAISIGDTYGGGAPITQTHLSTIQVWNVGPTGFMDVNSKFSLYNAKNSQDLRRNFGGYTKAANLTHWWRPGASPSQPGMDYANPSTGPINLTANYDERAIGLWGPT